MKVEQLMRALRALAVATLGESWFRDKGNIIMMERKKHFNAGRGPNGEVWARNKPSTIKRKGKDSPNIDTGAMRDAYIGEASDKHVRVKLANKRTQDVWQGKSIAQITDETRPHIAIPEEAIRKVEKALQLQVDKLVKKLFPRK